MLITLTFIYLCSFDEQNGMQTSFEFSDFNAQDTICLFSPSLIPHQLAKLVQAYNNTCNALSRHFSDFGPMCTFHSLTTFVKSYCCYFHCLIVVMVVLQRDKRSSTSKTLMAQQLYNVRISKTKRQTRRTHETIVSQA